MKLLQVPIFGLFLLLPITGNAVSIDILISTGWGYSRFEGGVKAPGAQGRDRISDINLNLMAGAGLLIDERWAIEISYLDHDIVPTINHAFYGVKGSGWRYLLGHRYPFNDWFSLGARAGALVWDYEIRPLAWSGVEWERHSGMSPYGGAFLRFGNERGGFFLGGDYSDLGRLDQIALWVGLELTLRVFD